MSTSETNEVYSLAGKENHVDTTDKVVKTTSQLNDTQQELEINNTKINEGEYQRCNDSLMKTPAVLTSRERRYVSSPSSTLLDAYVDPQSPSSSSSTSQTTNDATFEPTIEMMVNDFDDEQTLNEEEALASLESQDPDDEINTLKKESEMPLEELLAKYRDLPQIPVVDLYQEPLRKKTKNTHSHREKHKQKRKDDGHFTQASNRNEDKGFNSNKIGETLNQGTANLKVPDTKGAIGNNFPDKEKIIDFEEKHHVSSTLSLRKSSTPTANKEAVEIDDNPNIRGEISKVRRSHLLDLYPEGTFDNVGVNDSIGGNNMETLFDVEDEEIEEEEEEEEDEDYKKKVMIGTLYQATIPVGLSQYGDILPYENEDKLIWEPCQVSEREVEEYLIKIRDIKSNQQSQEDELTITDINPENKSKENGHLENEVEDVENNTSLTNDKTQFIDPAGALEIEGQAVVKDNEQALHLLVQCGYDFKEALRRKRLNALPFNDSMSLWSEEECHKFEEGIQKYGKDFLKIRQNQVRTRTMRELVQFYYLWKKSERRDHNFANADTVDHMDIYLNEDNEYGSNTSSILTPLNSPDGNNSNYTGTGRNSNFSQKSISIMTNTATTQAATNLSSEKNSSTSLQQHNHHQQHQKRRTHTCNQITSNTTTASDACCENLSNSSNSTK